MTRAHDAEVTVIEGRELRLAEPLGHSQHGAVDEADLQIRVGLEQFADSLVVLGRQILDRQGPAPHLVEDGVEGFIPRVPPEQVVDLDEDGGGDDAPLARAGEQRRAFLMVVVVAIERSDDRARVEDQRNGSGSKTSSLASLLRSPRPEWNAPMPVRGGCSSSSPVGRGAAGPISCSRASWTS